MIDLVTANEFTFTPSAFIAAYIEQDTSNSVSETTTNGGQLSTTPGKNLSDIDTQITSSTTGGGLTTVTHSGLPMSLAGPQNLVSEFYTAGQYDQVSFATVNGGSSGGGTSISGSFVDVLGQTVVDTRSVTKTTTTTSGSSQTVVLVLSYGQFRSKCVSAQSTIALIYTRVAEYLNSLV